MVLPITPTPILYGKHAKRFEKMIEEGLKNPVGLVPTPKLDQAMSDAKRPQYSRSSVSGK